VRFTSPSRRAAGLLAVSTIGLSTALLSVAGIASAETTPTTSPSYTWATTATDLTVPFGACTVDLVVTGGNGGSVGDFAGGFGFSYTLSVDLQKDDVLTLKPGTRGAATGAGGTSAVGAAGGAGGELSTEAAGDAGGGSGSALLVNGKLAVVAAGGGGAGTGAAGGDAGDWGGDVEASLPEGDPDYVADFAMGGGPAADYNGPTTGFPGEAGYAAGETEYYSDGEPGGGTDEDIADGIAGAGGAGALRGGGGGGGGIFGGGGGASVGDTQGAGGGGGGSFLDTDLVDYIDLDWATATTDARIGYAYEECAPETGTNPGTGTGGGTTNPGTGTSPVDEGPVFTLPAPASAGLKAGVQSLTFQWAPPSDTEGLTGYTMEAYLQYDENIDPATIPVDTKSVLSCDAPAGATSCTVLAAAGFSYAGFVQTVYGEEYGDYADAGVSGVVSGPAAPSATLPKADGTLTSNATDGKVVAGQQITISGKDFLPGSTVDLVVYSTPVKLGTATVLADGTFTATVTLPKSLENGVHHLVATGVDVNGNVRNLVVEVTVSGGTAVLAFTGFSALPYAGAGALALLAGGGLLVVSRRRQAA
jgi:hypothetical protein